MERNGSSGCPEMAFRYNGTLCACNPGRYLVNGSCALFETGGDWVVSSGVSPAPTFLTTVLPMDSIKRFTQSQVLLEVTFVLLLVWLAFCLALRFTRSDNGRNFWFRLRWWISRFDTFYDTKHWLVSISFSFFTSNYVGRKPQMHVHILSSESNNLMSGTVMKKKKKKRGRKNTLSARHPRLPAVAARRRGRFFSCVRRRSVSPRGVKDRGDIITKLSIEVHRVRPANAPDLLSFVNDLEFNITTISSMSCSHLRGLDSLVIGTLGSIDYRVYPLSTYVEYNCQNTSSGPTVSLKCNSCQIPRRNHYISWQFVDLPNDPAIAVGFRFNLSAKDHADGNHVSFVTGTNCAVWYALVDH
ncbi:hypothetical protein BHM03_00025992 [Ensete ventricosum]|nr:hypothetical protein BHM03_00025992 [Ensete ventricosum]